MATSLAKQQQVTETPRVHISAPAVNVTPNAFELTATKPDPRAVEMYAFAAKLAFASLLITKLGKSSESVQCTMLKACDACADMGQL